MIDAEYISNALNGKKSGSQYYCDCPVGNHRRAKLYLKDSSTGVLLHCKAGCEFRDIVKELESRGLWAKKDYSPEEKRIFEKRKLAKEAQEAVIWIACYEADPKARTPKDDIKYQRLQKQYSYQIWANKVIDEYRVKIARGYRLSEKQIGVVMKAVNVLS